MTVQIAKLVEASGSSYNRVRIQKRIRELGLDKKLSESQREKDTREYESLCLSILKIEA